MATEEKACPFERLGAWINHAPDERAWNSYMDYRLGRLNFVASASDTDGRWCADGDTLPDAAEALCKQLGI